MKIGDVYTSRGGEIAYKLLNQTTLNGQMGWHCEVYKKLAGEFYICMRGSVVDEGRNWEEVCTGQGFISHNALDGFCELKNDIMLMQPKEVTASSRN